MDPGPPDSKRQRLASWSGSQPASLPHPHSHHHPPPPPPHSHSHAPATQLPPPSHPPPPTGPPHHHHTAPSPYQPYSSRPSDIPSAPPTPGSVHGHVQHHSDVDRRHHEPESLAPMQDPYRQQPQQPPHQHPHQHQQHQHQHHQHQHQHQHPHQQQPPPPPPPQSGQSGQQHPPSPAHPPYLPPYAPRESIIKREGPEDHRRPNSTGHTSESVPPTPQAVSNNSHPQPPPPPPPPSFQDNQPRHMNYDSGPSVPPTPGGYRTPAYAAPTPISHQPPYEPQGGYQSSQDGFYSVYSSSAIAKKKNTRASQACDQCRQLKAKCDETKPCKTCRDKGTECKYRDPVPKATDKAQADILDGIQAMQGTLTAMADRVFGMDDRLTRIETELRIQKEAARLKRELSQDRELKAVPGSPAVADEQPIHRPFIPEITRDQPIPPAEQAVPMHSESSIPIAMIVDEVIDAEPGPPVAPGEPAIPINHTTLAGLLLEWDPIRELTKHHLEQEGVRYISEYPISREQNRGMLKVYGRGEDPYSIRHTTERADHGTIDMGDDMSDVASSSPAADWGQLGGLSPGDQVEYRGGVLGFDGNPDFTESKIATYVESFKTNILNMHPIVLPKWVDDWVRHFLDELPLVTPKTAKPQPSRSAFAVSQNPSEAPGSKRKRSPELEGPGGPSTPAPVRVGKPNRSIHSALVLTIIALGKVCLHRDNVPDVVSPGDPLPYGSPITRNGVPPSPTQGSPPGFSSHSQSSGLPSPKEHERGHQSRRSSIHGPGGVRSGYSLKKNYEVIPGLEYFALATDILGNHTGAYNNIKNVYANIFAGLYHGQLARPLESFSFIHKASHKLQVIMRPSLDKLRKTKRNAELIQDPKYNYVALAFWTCLQLESDLIAELPLPPSGLLQYEDDMPHPNMSLLQGFDQRILDSYPGQLYLRTHLNSIHRMFYAPDDSTKSASEKFKNVRLVADAVSGMNWVPRSFFFKEDDAPAGDILSARLRAKYWGAQVITYRPFVRQILQWSYEMKRHPSSPHVPIMSEYRDGIIAPFIHPDTTSPSQLDPSIIDLAEKGIKALIESTRAFHGLGDKRPIITNVFGTAHAQWGNMLVLTAAFKDPVLHKFINEDLLRTLFHKTIAFLRQSATQTSSLSIDMHILEGLQRDLFQVPDGRTNSSFSSNATLHTPKLAMTAPPQQMSFTSDSGMGQIVSSQPIMGLPQGQ